jgi:chemotaxis protein methyltransferase CheR
LKKNEEEFQNLLNDLTINYTMFFRDADVYTYLEKALLPKILQSSKSTKIWSAGCASGEEPYSLAILVHKVLKQSIANHPVTIFASDIDKDALATASKGQYNIKQLGALDATQIDQFFTKEGNIYKIKDFVRKIIHFHEFDLMAQATHLNVDLILCRNVMIYFSKEAQQQIHMSFFNVLNEGGYLVTGKSEILSGEPAIKFLAVDHQVRVYQKPNKTKDALKFSAANLYSKPLSV